MAASDCWDHVVGRGGHAGRLCRNLVWPCPFMDGPPPGFGWPAAGCWDLLLRLFETGFQECPTHNQHSQRAGLPVRLLEMDKLPPGHGDDRHGDSPAPLFPHP